MSVAKRTRLTPLGMEVFTMKVLVLLLWLSPALWAQEASRDIWDTGFLQKRPAKTGSAAGAKAQTGASYRAQAKEAGDARVYTEAAVGFTLWRLRPPLAKDREGARLLVQDRPGAAANELVPERFDSVAALHVGDRIRLSIESPRRGFLYVIDRERYRDGTAGEPFLIFPTLNQNHGDNEVFPGRALEIPSRDAPFNALLITHSGERHTGEDLTLIVSPVRLEGIVPAEGQQALPPELVAAWEKRWAAGSLMLNLEGAPKDAWSPAEQKAGGTTPEYLLTQSDPLPATILSVPPRDTKQAILVHVPLVVE